MTSRWGSDRCCYRNCRNGTNTGHKLYGFPSNLQRQKTWLECVGNTLLSILSGKTLVHYKVCECHFRDGDFFDARRLKLFDNTVIPIHWSTVRSSSLHQLQNEGDSQLPAPLQSSQQLQPNNENSQLTQEPMEMECELLPDPPISRGVLVVSAPRDPGQPETDDSDCLDTFDNVENAEVDPAFLDHDYLGNLKPYDQQKIGNLKENGKYPSKQLLLQDVRRKLCRLCGRKGPSLTPIFNSTSCVPSEEVTLWSKIEMHLPFKVKVDDPLPSHICEPCSQLLSRWHELYVTSVAADAALWKTFGGESHVSSRKDQECSSNRNQDNDGKCADSAEKQEEKANEADEEHDILCSACGMNTPSNPPKEDDSLIEEFEKFYSKIRSVKYKCKYCCEFFLSPCAKKEHLISCRELSTICECCGKSGIRRKDIQIHKSKMHRKVVVCTCDRCGKCFKSNAVFQRHYYRVHVQCLAKQFCCTRCCTAYVDEKLYRTHMKTHEKGELKTEFQIEKYLDGEGLYVCPVCNEIFNDTLSFVVHLTSKNEIKCSSCLKHLSNEKKFILHECKNWKCQFCSRSFKRKMQCVIHERLHTGEKPIKCKTCDKSFHSFRHRIRHETVHAPSLQCTICNKEFRNKYVFEDHLQWHDGKVFLCSICGKGFRARKTLKKHAKLLHKDSKVEITVATL